MKKSFSLLEIIVVTIIVGILATLGVSHFGVVREKVIDREAISQLRLIQSTERVVLLEATLYTGCANTAACNTALNLQLPSDNWDYAVADVVGPPPTFTATASRTGGSWNTCVWTITDDPSVAIVNNGNCATP